MNSQAAAIATTPKPAKTKSAARSNFREYGLMIALIAIMIFFQMATSGTLFKPLNLTNLVLQNSYVVIMALGMLLVIVADHIDLSVGSVAGFIGALAAVMMVRFGINFFLASVLCLIAGAAIGASQGYWIAYHKIPSFIVTLAGMLVFRGLTLALLGGNSIGPFPIQFQLLSSGFIPDPFGNTGFRFTSMLIGALIAVGIFFISLRTRLNRRNTGFAEGRWCSLFWRTLSFPAWYST
jgi:putative multiple sugar transport system permease protein